MRIAKWTAYTGLLLLLCSPAQLLAVEGSEASELTRMFRWWNDAMRSADGLTEEGFAAHFTPDAAIIINNRVLVRGIPAMVRHFRAIRSRTDSVEVLLPFEEEFRAGDKLFTHHRIHALEEGRRRVTYVMGYALVTDERISLVNFVTHSEYPDAREP